MFPEEVETVLEQDDNFAEVCVFGAMRTTGAKDGTEEIMTVIVPTDEILKNIQMMTNFKISSFMKLKICQFNLHHINVRLILLFEKNHSQEQQQEKLNVIL